jgi:uncharacterized membrane protein YczE
LFKSINWKTFGRDFVVIQIGFGLFGISIALTIRANLGTGAWSVFEVALSQLSGLTPGTLTVIVGFSVLLIAMLFKEKVGWGTLGNILCIGPWEDFFLRVFPSIKGNLPLQSGMLLAAILIQGVASAIYIGVNAGAGPRDSLMLAVKRKTGLGLGMARGMIEVTIFIIGWILKGPAGFGTAVFAFLVGPAVHWSFKIFNVHPHQDDDLPVAEAAAD